MSGKHAKKDAVLDRYVLFTNLQYVSVGPVRAHAGALLLEEHGARALGPPRLARAFGTEAAWPVIDLVIESIEYELISAQSTVVVVGDGGPRPLMTGAILRIQGSPDIQLIVHDDDRPIDVSRYEGDEHTILKVWSALEEKVAHYWTRPAMPRLTFMPPQMHAPSSAAQWGGDR